MNLMIVGICLILSSCSVNQKVDRIVVRYMNEDAPKVESARCEGGLYALCHVPDEFEVEEFNRFGIGTLEPHIVFVSTASLKEEHFDHDGDRIITCEKDNGSEYELGEPCPPSF